MKVIIHNHRGRTLKRTLDLRIDPDFVDDLVAAPEELREGGYAMLEPHIRRRLRRLVNAKLAQHE